MEAALLGTFMISASCFGALLELPGSPVREAIASPLVRRTLMGLAMGLTAIALVTSPFGKRSGGHLNPSVTLTFFRLGKVEAWDAAFYALFQFLGGIAGVAIATAFLGPRIADPHVHWVTTTPGAFGVVVAFVAEVAISCVLMFTVLTVSNVKRLNRFTPLFAGALVATYITIEAPISGMSMNPARTLASAFSAGDWTALWIYFTAPPLGMFVAAEIYRRTRGTHAILCAKLHHENHYRCIFRCSYES
ncbi:MAG: aquaporin [Planctomycetes bacterium]|nr:aquaporin [Planctomycetota bacterium]MBI3843745.1 aquaporin [Planctomycetota bacterium]